MRLIDADKLIQTIANTVTDSIRKTYETGAHTFNEVLDRLSERQHEIIDMINESPTINPDDCRPHGRWKIKLDEYDCEYVMCSVCGEEYYDANGEDTVDITFINCCPNCGAKMDGKENDE